MSARARRAARPALWATAFLAALVLAPPLADACPVCMAQRDEESRLAFLLTTGLLTVLPLAMIGGAVAWLRWQWRAREREAEAQAERGEQRADVGLAPVASSE